jgi:hypothetical protein
MSSIQPASIRPAGTTPVRPGNAAPAARPAERAAALTESPAPPRTAAAPTLWEILTPEERSFFERQATLGALTYRPGRSAAPAAAAAPLGQRLDVKG